jgi:hypothetical protein
VATFTERAGPAEGNIILSCFIGRGTTEDQIRSQIGRGIIGYINCARFSRFPGILENLRDGSDISEINIPVWDAAYKDIEKIINYMQSDTDNITVIIEVGFEDPNPWMEAFNSGAFPVISAFLGGYALVVVALAIWKLSLFIRAFGPQRSIPQVCLWIELFANLERAIYLAVDPWFCRGIFPLAASHILYTISLPATPATSLLITLYWKELLTNQKSKTVTFLDKAQIPFYVAVSIIWAFEFTIAVLRSVGEGPLATLVTIISVFYGVALLFTSIFFFIYGDRLLKTLNSTKSRVQSEKTKSKYSAIKLLFASAACQLGVVLFLIFNATDYAFYPFGLVGGNTAGFIMVISTAFFKVLAFSVPISKKSSSGINERKPSSVSLPNAVSSSRLRGGSAASIESPANTPLPQPSIERNEAHQSVELESPVRLEAGDAKTSEEEVAIAVPKSEKVIENDTSSSGSSASSDSKSGSVPSSSSDKESANNV